jgi:uncharacterized RDD family membrane protein YckC
LDTNDDVISKETRVNLINRRSTAWLIEISVLNILLVPVAFVLWIKALEPTTMSEVTSAADTVSFLVWAAYLLVRDLLGEVSYGKRICGLKIIRDDHQKVTGGQKVIRNIPLIVPVVPLIEYFVAYKGQGMKRIGDRIAGTRVVAVDPEASRAGSYSGPLVLALIATVASHHYMPKVADYIFEFLS